MRTSHIFGFLILLASCTVLVKKEGKYTLDQAEKIFVKDSEVRVREVFGEPREKIDLNKFKDGKNVYGWYYYDEKESSQYKVAVFFDSRSQMVERVSWYTTPSDPLLSLESFENRYANKVFKKEVRWRGPHSGGGYFEYLANDKSISIIMYENSKNGENLILKLRKP